MRITCGKARVLLAGAFASSLAILAIACSSDGAKPATGGGGGTTDAAAGIDHQVDPRPDKDAGLVFAPDAAGGAVMCPVAAFGGPTVDARVVRGSPPADTGGSITPGTYDLTALEIYDEVTAEDDGGVDAGLGANDHARATIVLTATMMQVAKTVVSPASGGVPISTASTSKQHVSDVFLVLDDTCPGTDSRQIPFTATATTITLHSAMVRREIYTLRP